MCVCVCRSAFAHELCCALFALPAFRCAAQKTEGDRVCVGVGLLLVQKMDDLSRCLSDLRSRTHDVRAHAARKLKEYVKLQQKEMPGEEFNKFMVELNR